MNASKIDDSFYDDSSTKLSLGHNPVASPAGVASFKGRGIAAWDKAEQEKIRKGERAGFDRRVRELQADGCTLKQAHERAAHERDHPLQKSEIEDHESKRMRATLRLMNADLKTKGGSSGSKSKFKQRKTGTRVCANCHLEGCQCYIGPGRPRIVGSRSVTVGAKVSQRVRERLDELGEAISAGMITELVVEAAIERGLSTDQIKEELRGLRSSAAA